MKKLFFFFICMLLTTFVLVMYEKANREYLENPEIKKAVSDLNGHYIVGTDTVKVSNGKIEK